MESRPLISVIVPVYNVISHLRECLDSIVKQTYPRLEVILVDDGSTDGSGCVCDEYEMQYSNFSVIHKDNGGLSSARNKGVAYAHGKYLSFVDSDDWVSPIFIESLHAAITRFEAPIAAVRGGLNFVNSDDVELCFDGIESLLTGSLRDVPSEEYQRLLLYQRCATGAQFRLYDVNLIRKHPFPLGLLYEDMATIYKIVHEASHIAVLETECLYAYRINPSGITRQNFSMAKLDSVISATREMNDSIVSWYPNLKNAVASRCFGALRAVFAQVPTCDTESSELLWAELITYRKLVLSDRSSLRKREIAAAMFSLLGKTRFQGFCRLCKKMGLMA